MSASAPPGLCATCRHSRILRTQRGSVFRLCERSRFDVRFPRYPTLPVVRCAGFEPGVDVAVPDPVSEPGGGSVPGGGVA